MALNQSGNQVVYETAKRHLTRALRSPAQLREQMTWFWMNHFTVFSGKANVRWTLAEYEEQSVRAHALGTFSDLVLATVTSPAMLEYLDNAQSAAGKINENYARELMELHTLGVSGGPSGSRYTQQDVQELARVLTGVGLNLSDNTPRLPADQKALYIRRGLFEFNPCSATPSRDAASPRSRTRSRSCAGSRPPRGSSAPSSPATSSRTIRRRRWSIAWRGRSRRPTDRSRRCCAKCSSTAASPPR
jgi:hypothetical protein